MSGWWFFSDFVSFLTVVTFHFMQPWLSVLRVIFCAAGVCVGSPRLYLWRQSLGARDKVFDIFWMNFCAGLFSFILLNMEIQFSQHHLKRLLFSQCMFVISVETQLSVAPGVCVWSSVLAHCSVGRFCPCGSSLRSGIATPPALFFMLMVTLAIWGFLCLLILDCFF